MAPARRIAYRPLMHGQGVRRDVNKALKFTKNNHLISRGLGAAAPFTAEFAPVVGAAAGIAGLLGWGKKKRRRKAVKKKAPVKRTRKVRRKK